MAFTSLQPDSTTAWLHLILTASPGIYLVSSTGDELLQGSYQSWRAKALALVLVPRLLLLSWCFPQPRSSKQRGLSNKPPQGIKMTDETLKRNEKKRKNHFLMLL